MIDLIEEETAFKKADIHFLNPGVLPVNLPEEMLAH
jgi:hypothetical protein